MIITNQPRFLLNTLHLHLLLQVTKALFILRLGDGILLPEGRNEAVPYQISENIDLGPLFYAWSNNLVCEVATDENGVVKEIMVFHESYGDGFTEEDARFCQR